MILDYENLFANDQAITATAVSENIIDRGSDKDSGPGEPLELLVQVTEDFATLTSLQVEVQTDDNSAFSSARTVTLSEDIAAADLVAGKQFPIRALPHSLERYVRLRFVVTGTNATAGKVVAGIVFDKQQGVGHAY